MMMPQHRKGSPYKQKGATLATTLVFLMLMTIVSVSATKISILDVLVAGNEQQQMLMFQETANDLKELTTPVVLITTLSNKGITDSWIHDVPANSEKPNSKQKITNREKTYQCGGFAGLAISIGPDTSPCMLFDFEAKSGLPNTGVVDKHTRGAGKEFPKATRNNYNN